MAKRSPATTYACSRCSVPCTGAIDSVLALLQLCAGCQASRVAAGKAAQLKAEAEEAARAR